MQVIIHDERFQLHLVRIILIADVSTRCSSPPQGEWAKLWETSIYSYVCRGMMACTITNCPMLDMLVRRSIYDAVGWISTSELCSSPDPSSVLSSLRLMIPSLQRSKQTSSTKCHAPMKRCTLARLYVDSKHVWRSIRMHASKASQTSLPSWTRLDEAPSHPLGWH